MAEPNEDQGGEEEGRREVAAAGVQLNSGQIETQAPPQHMDYRLQQAANFEPKDVVDEVVQVVYQSDQHGSLVGIESTSLLSSYTAPTMAGQHFDVQHPAAAAAAAGSIAPGAIVASIESMTPSTDAFSAAQIASGHQQLSRAGSTLPPVAEESTGSVPLAVGEPAGAGDVGNGGCFTQDSGIAQPPNAGLDSSLKYFDTDRDVPAGPMGAYSAVSSANLAERAADFNTDSSQQQEHLFGLGQGEENGGQANLFQQAPIYSTVNRHNQAHVTATAASFGPVAPIYSQQDENSNNSNNNDIQLADDTNAGAVCEASQELDGPQGVDSLGGDLVDYRENGDGDDEQRHGDLDEAGRVKEEISQIIVKQGAGPVEKGSFRNNFRKKLGLSVSTNENDLTAYRQKFIDSVQDDDKTPSSALDEQTYHQHSHHHHQQQQQQQVRTPVTPASVASAVVSQKLKRTHSVSFNVNSSRSNRHSVDIRNLPSYLTHKRASIVDVARGAMSSLISSFGGGSSSGSAISGSHRRDSMGYNDSELDNEPIFEEPIAPTLSLGQRVAMVRNSGTEFGTVGWIGQLPDIDDDWIVGVIFDNMIGDCDGAYKGARYFYARDHYAMFVPLSVLTKTDNYIGRPETGTVLSRMSVSLKPGQLISIQRSSIRLQHCFLNAPHQRVGHDVRAVSNRLHCQCHNCGPCAHLTKQGRPNVLPHFGAHHLPHRKKNSLAHAAVEMLAHHHHHFHEEEEHDEKDYEFGDNAAHACNFVRYSCCQQSGSPGHEFSSDCGMVRPELLDNLIHAPKAPHRRSRPRRTRQRQHQQQQRSTRRSDQHHATVTNRPPLAAIEADGAANTNTNTLETNKSALTGTQTNTSTMKSSVFESSEITESGQHEDGESHSSYSLSHSPSASSSSTSPSNSSSRSPSLNGPPQEPYNYYQYDTSSFRPQNNVFQTVSSQVNIVDQQRFVYRRDSSAYMQSSKPSNWSDDGDSVQTTSGFGRRMLRCLGCLRRRTGSRRRPRRKLSFKDRVLEYRRRQSTFVPSTLAKPHEDFASHGIVMNSIEQAAAIVEVRSDYSSCSKSSSCSSRSESPSPHYRPDQDFMAAGVTEDIGIDNNDNNIYQQQTTMTMEHGGYPTANDQLKSAHSAIDYDYSGVNDQDDYKRQLNYGDFNFSDGYDSYKKNEPSKDSALTDFAYSDTYKTNSSSDTLKFLVDQSINEQVVPPQPMYENDILSPISSIEHRGDSATSDQVDISSPTASAIDHEDEEEEQLSQGVENIVLAPEREP